MQIVLSYTTNDIITAALGCTVGHMTRKGCDCVVHGSEVWTWLHRCNSHDNNLLKLKLKITTDKTKICIFGESHNQLPFFWEGIPLRERVSAYLYRYLEVWITSNAEFRTSNPHFLNSTTLQP